MHSFAVFIQMILQRMILGQRLNQLQFDIAQIKVRQANIRLLDDFTQDQRKTELIAIKLQSFIRVPHDDGNVIELLEHPMRMPGKPWGRKTGQPGLKSASSIR